MDLLCGTCTEIRARLYSEELRDRSLAQQARTCQRKKMPFADSRVAVQEDLYSLSRRLPLPDLRNARLDVHHNTYETYGDERPQDLVVLCESCHGLFHGGLQDAS